MRIKTLKYLKQHKTGYMRDLKKALEPEEIRKLELLNLIDRGQDIKETKRVNSYKVNEQILDEILYLYNEEKPKKHPITAIINKIINKFNVLFMNKGLFD